MRNRMRESMVDRGEYTMGRQVRWETHHPVDDCNDQEQILIAPGFLSGRNLYRSLASELATEGQLVTVMAHETGGAQCPDEIATMSSQLADTHQRSVRVVGHSLGGIHAVKAAHRSGDDMSGLLLMQPAGFGDVHAHRALEGVLSRDNVHPNQLVSNVGCALDGLRYALRGRVALPGDIAFALQHKVVDQAAAVPDHLQRDALLFGGDHFVDTTSAARGLFAADYQVHFLDDPSARHNAQRYPAYKVGQAVMEIINPPAIHYDHPTNVAV